MSFLVGSPGICSPGIPRLHSCRDSCVGLASIRIDFISCWVLPHPPVHFLILFLFLMLVLRGFFHDISFWIFPDSVSKFGDCLASGVGRQLSSSDLSGFVSSGCGCSCEDCKASVTSILVGISASVAAAVFSPSSVALFSGVCLFGGVSIVAKMAFVFLF